MSIDKYIKERRSTYTSQFSGEIIANEVIQRLFENANWAPNHYNTEPWRFLVYSGAALNRLLDELADIYRKSTAELAFSEAKFQKFELRKTQISHAVVIVVNKSGHPNIHEIEEVCATACAVQNLWLTLADTSNIGGYWSTGNSVFTKQFANFIALKDNQECLGIFYLGVKKIDAITPNITRQNWQDKVTFHSL